MVITGIGAVTPLGNTFMDSWDTSLAGRSGIAPISRFDAGGLRWRVAGEVRGFEPSRYLSAKEIAHLDPFVHYAVAASKMALDDASLGSGAYSDWGGVIIGSSRGGISTLEKAISGYHQLGKKGRFSPFLMPATTINAAPSFCAQKFGMKGYCLGISNACASGTNALGEAYRLLRTGYAGPVLAGGAEAPVCEICIGGYGASGALTRRSDHAASRPFDRARSGFVISEGACVLLLERLEPALDRGARIYAEVIGYANTSDAFHPTRPDSAGEANAIAAALADAGISPGDIAYLSTHGTSTVLGDAAEAAAVRRVFGQAASVLPASALKSMTGHMLGASGALETAFAAMTLLTGIVPPTINLDEKDRDCDLNIITERSGISGSVAISQSFGFGGVNAVLVLKSDPQQAGP